MKCLRCGRCCFYAVVVVHPNAVKEDLDLDSMEISDSNFIFLDGSEKCPHLTWDDDRASCAIHHHKWFPSTPCGTHTQLELDETDECRIGKYMRSSPKVWKAATKRI